MDTAGRHAATPRGARVLLLDDDESVLRSVARLLRSAGHTVEPFSSPREFLRRAPAEEAGCAVIDLSMPEMTGLDVQAALQASGCLLPLVFMSGAADVPEAIQALKAGAVDFLVKPFMSQAMLDAVTRALERSELLRAAAAPGELPRSTAAVLTRREREACALAAAGRVSRSVAAELVKLGERLRGTRQSYPNVGSGGLP